MNEPYEAEPRCGGGGELHEVLTPRLDHRDPAFETREWVCPGCLDCEDPMAREREPVEVSGGWAAPA